MENDYIEMGADDISLAAAAVQTAEAASFADSADENERQQVSRKEDSCAIIFKKNNMQNVGYRERTKY